MPGSDIVLPIVLTAVAAYLLGSISFSIILTRCFAKTDVREHGSGNAGTTNVLRTAGARAAALTFVGDFLKCVAAICFGVFIFRFFSGSNESMSIFNILFGGTDVQLTFVKFIAGVFCMLGHIFPVYFDFRGGKGVVTTCALMLMISWQCFLIAIGIFLLMMLITRIVSLSVITAAVSLPVSACVTATLMHSGYALVNTLMAAFMAGILIVMHRSNIKRLLAGKEPRIGRKTA